MKDVTLQLVLAPGLPSWGISYFGAGGYSHVDLVLPDGSLLGARSDKVVFEGIRFNPGVQIRPPEYARWIKRTVMTLRVASSVADLFYEAAKGELCKPYDTTAIWGFAAGRNWREDDSWFCSELAAYCLEKSGALPCLLAPVNKITPGTLATVLSGAGARWKGFTF